MKQKLREKFLQKRCSLSEKEREKKSKQIINGALQLREVKNAVCISCYVGVNSEVKTRQLIRKLLSLKKTVLVPVVLHNKMKMCRIQSLKELKKNGSFFEPGKEKQKPCPIKKIDLVFVPLIAVDSKGRRLGYGKGYYDRFLSQLGERVPFIGLGFECQLAEKIPVKEHDVNLNKIVTEKREIEC